MFLFILESIGTSELILVGIVALIFLGPRRLPELARKAGKIMAEFRGTANEFKETWQREVNFEEEAKALDLNALEAESVQRTTPVKDADSLAEPEIKQVDPSKFEHLAAASQTEKSDPLISPIDPSADANNKENWL